MKNDLKRYSVSIIYDHKTGNRITEEWKTPQGHSYNPHGAAISSWDENTENLTYECFTNELGQVERTINYDPKTQEVIRDEEYTTDLARQLDDYTL